MKWKESGKLFLNEVSIALIPIPDKDKTKNKKRKRKLQVHIPDEQQKISIKLNSTSKRSYTTMRWDSFYEALKTDKSINMIQHTNRMRQEQILSTDAEKVVNKTFLYDKNSR